jgi:hypothetical protein
MTISLSTHGVGCGIEDILFLGIANPSNPGNPGGPANAFGSVYMRVSGCGRLKI